MADVRTTGGGSCALRCAPQDSRGRGARGRRRPQQRGPVWQLVDGRERCVAAEQPRAAAHAQGTNCIAKRRQRERRLSRRAKCTSVAPGHGELCEQGARLRQRLLRRQLRVAVCDAHVREKHRELVRLQLAVLIDVVHTEDVLSAQPVHHATVRRGGVHGNQRSHEMVEREGCAAKERAGVAMGKLRRHAELGREQPGHVSLSGVGAPKSIIASTAECDQIGTPPGDLQHVVIVRGVPGHRVEGRFSERQHIVTLPSVWLSGDRQSVHVRQSGRERDPRRAARRAQGYPSRSEEARRPPSTGIGGHPAENATDGC